MFKLFLNIIKYLFDDDLFYEYEFPGDKPIRRNVYWKIALKDFKEKGEKYQIINDGYDFFQLGCKIYWVIYEEKEAVENLSKVSLSLFDRKPKYNPSDSFRKPQKKWIEL